MVPTGSIQNSGWRNKSPFLLLGMDVRKIQQEVRAPQPSHWLPVCGRTRNSSEYSSSALDLFSLIIVAFSWDPTGSSKRLMQQSSLS